MRIKTLEHRARYRGYVMQKMCLHGWQSTDLRRRWRSFYFHQRDWIVLNEDNPNFELYKMVVENYEDFSDSSKKEFAEKCKKISQSSPGS